MLFLAVEHITERMQADAQAAYDQREEELTPEVMRELERRVVLSVLDSKWREHLYEMDYLQSGIHMRGHAQRDPLVEYQREGFSLFTAMMDAIKEESVGYLFHLDVQVEEAAAAEAAAAQQAAEAAAAERPLDGSAAEAVVAALAPGAAPAARRQPDGVALRDRRPQIPHLRQRCRVGQRHQPHLGQPVTPRTQHRDQVTRTQLGELLDDRHAATLKRATDRNDQPERRESQ